MRKALEIGGLVAGVVLIAFGVVAIVMGVNGGSTVSSNLKREQIVGTPDMTPAGIKADAQKAGLKNVSFPTCSVANKAVTSGATARCFAQYMQIHAWESVPDPDIIEPTDAIVRIGTSTICGSDLHILKSDVRGHE